MVPPRPDERGEGPPGPRGGGPPGGPPGGGGGPPGGGGGPPGGPSGPYNPGSMRGRNVENENIRSDEKGDVIEGLPQSEQPNDVLRLKARELDSRSLIPPSIQQIRSDIEFDMFSVVRPGFGLGVDNKMFLYENIRDKDVIGSEPLYTPRPYNGPSSGVDRVPLLLQDVVPSEVYTANTAANNTLAAAGRNTTRRTGKGSLNVLGDDYGQLDSISDRGLNRPPESFLEPIIRTDARWQRPKLQPGFLSSKREFRKLYDGLRYPEHIAPHMNMDGGPTLKKSRSSLEVLI